MSTFCTYIYSDEVSTRSPYLYVYIVARCPLGVHFFRMYDCEVYTRCPRHEVSTLAHYYNRCPQVSAGVHCCVQVSACYAITNAIQDIMLPIYRMTLHYITRYTHAITRNYMLSHVIRMLPHAITRYHTLSHAITCYHTLSHVIRMLSHAITRYHTAITRYHTLSHAIIHFVTPQIGVYYRV